MNFKINASCDIAVGRLPSGHSPPVSALQCLSDILAGLASNASSWLAGGHRTCSCAALGQGAQLVQVSRQLFMSFVMARPRTLQIYLHKVS